MISLAAEDAPTRTILLAGAGAFEQANITKTRGIYIGEANDAADGIQAGWAQIADRTGEQAPTSGAAQYHHEVNHPGRVG